ncbi:MAG: hypothetical protein U0169_04425 [Polyangiaceae bacterium]
MTTSLLRPSRRSSWAARVVAWGAPLTLVGLVWCASPKSAESAPSTMVGGNLPTLDTDDPTFDDGPSANCPVDAGSRDSGTKKANGEPCTNFKECESGFCSKIVSKGRGAGFCASCAVPVCNTVTDHGQDVVVMCTANSGALRCTTARHHPCAGSHDNLYWERCFPGRRPETGHGVRCEGGPVTSSGPCSSFPEATTNCGDPGPHESGVWDNNTQLSPLCN